VRGLSRSPLGACRADKIGGLSGAVSIDPDGSGAGAVRPLAATQQAMGLAQPVPAAAPAATSSSAAAVADAAALDTNVLVEAGARAGASAPVARTRWWVEALVVAWLCWVYDMTTNLAPLRLHLALSHAEAVLALERSLGIDPELSLDRWLAGHRTLGLIVSDYYDNAHFIVTLGLLGWLWWSRADLYRPLRNTLVLANVIAFAVFWLYPVAPPRMLTGDGFSDIVAASHAFGSWHTGALASAANQLAAMPSLHIAWAAWCTVVVWRLSRRVWLRGLALLYPCLTGFAVLATGNHYVLDVLAGLVTLGLAMLLASSGERIFRKLRT
jgi:predicted nucleic acid-binding protein